METFLKKNSEASQNSKAIKFLINEYLASADIKSACDKITFIDKDIQNNYLDKFMIYCLINSDRKDEALLVLDLLKERGFKDKFFENKVSFLLNRTEKTTQKISDDSLLNFIYLISLVRDSYINQMTKQTNIYGNIFLLLI